MNKSGKTSAKSLNKAKGDEGERIAADFLEKIGYKVLETKFKGGRGEIDIIAENEAGILNFIEVKTRFKDAFGKPVEAVDRKKLDKIIRASNFYLSGPKAENSKEQANYGVISVEYIERGSVKLIFFENIFD